MTEALIDVLKYSANYTLTFDKYVLPVMPTSFAITDQISRVHA